MARQVVEAAETLGYYAARAMRVRAQAEPPRRTFGFLMQQRGRSLYQMLGNELKAATLASSAVRGEAVVEHIIAICARTCARSASARIFGSVPPNAYQSTLDLLHHTPDLVGLFIAGGGKSGVLRGLREDASGLAKTVNVVGLDLTPEARSGLLDGVVDVILSHPIKSLAETTVELLASVTAGETNGEPVQRLLPFEIYTPENL